MRRVPTPVTAPATEPVTVAELKALARIDGSDEDSLIADFIEAARTCAEKFTRRSFITQTHKLTLDLACSQLYDSLPEGVYDLPVSALYGGLPSEIYLPRGPVQSVSSVVTYDTSNSPSTYSSSNYQVLTASDRLVLNRDATWPSSLREKGACEITFVAGYGDAAANVPMPIRMAIRVHAAQLYETRGQCGCEEPPGACQAMLRQYRLMDL